MSSPTHVCPHCEALQKNAWAPCTEPISNGRGMAKRCPGCLNIIAIDRGAEDATGVLTSCTVEELNRLDFLKWRIRQQPA